MEREVCNSSLFLKYRYKVPGLNSASEAISSIVEAVNPFWEKIFRAAVMISFFLCSFSLCLRSYIPILSPLFFEYDS